MQQRLQGERKRKHIAFRDAWPRGRSSPAPRKFQFLLHRFPPHPHPTTIAAIDGIPCGKFLWNPNSFFSAIFFFFLENRCLELPWKILWNFNSKGSSWSLYRATFPPVEFRGLVSDPLSNQTSKINSVRGPVARQWAPATLR